MNTQTKSAHGNSARRKEQGFSLIELLIVVAIILIIAAIAIPNLIRARIAANDSSAASSVRSIGTAQIAYNSTYNAGYGTLAQLGTPALPCVASAASACLLDDVVTAGTKSGYTITAVPAGAGNTTFVGAAVPVSVGVTGQRSFCADETGVIRYDVSGGGAPANDVACEVFPRLQ
jgi:type IV pilus assembly protein PilA